MPLDLPNPSFSREVPGLQLAFDSVSLGALKKCPRFYQLNIVEGWAPKGEQADLFFGIVYHGALERYDHAKTAGASHDEALRTAVRWAMIETWNAELQRPLLVEHNYKNRFNLIRTIVWYCDKFQDDPIKTVILANGKPAVELSYRLELDYHCHLSNETFVHCGHLDKLGTFQDKTVIVDKKTTKHQLDDRFYEQFSPDNQMSGYAFAGKIVYNTPIKGIIIDAAQVAVTFSRFDRRLIERTASMLDEWHRDLGFWLTAAQQFARAQYWPMNDRACFGCTYRGICGKSPEVREQWLAANFVRRVWNPLETRGDV